MQLRAPAKINLSLRILEDRADGFHEIETLMAPVSVCDFLSLNKLESAGTIEFVCDDPTVPAGDDNLVVRATRLFLKATGLKAGVRIALEKRIPHGAGLGGGSSDAAAILLGLNDFLAAGLSQSRLSELGAEIGSDVPFFIFRSAAWCSGRGEIVTPAKLEKPFRLLLLKPSFQVPTPWAYGRWRESRELPGMRYEPQDFAGLRLVNDLERPVFEKFIFLARMKMWLLEQTEVGAAMMSGSGSTVFGVLREGADADGVAARARAELDPELWTSTCETT